MIKRLFFLTTIAVCLSLAGCAAKPGQNTYSYTAPALQHINNTKVVAMPFDDAWDQLVAQLSTGYFVINNIDKQSRIINLSFSAKNPVDFVDCGTSTRTTQRGKKPVRTISYPYVASNQFTLEGGAWDVFEIQSHIKRNCRLEGRINIYLAPVSKNKTKFTVTARYVVTRKAIIQDVYTSTLNSDVVQYATPTSNTDNDAFTTNLPYASQEQEGQVSVTVQCGSKGTLEQEILNML